MWTVVCGCHNTYSVCRKELRQVHISSGSMAHRVITLLNLASRMLRCSPAVSVWLADELTNDVSFRRLVKYCSDKDRHVFQEFLHCLFKKKRLYLNKVISYHSSCHEEVPWQQCPQTEQKENQPHARIPFENVLLIYYCETGRGLATYQNTCNIKHLCNILFANRHGNRVQCIQITFSHLGFIKSGRWRTHWTPKARWGQCLLKDPLICVHEELGITECFSVFTVSFITVNAE